MLCSNASDAPTQCRLCEEGTLAEARSLPPLSSLGPAGRPAVFCIDITLPLLVSDLARCSSIPAWCVHHSAPVAANVIFAFFQRLFSLQISSKTLTSREFRAQRSRVAQCLHVLLQKNNLTHISPQRCARVFHESFRSYFEIGYC